MAFAFPVHVVAFGASLRPRVLKASPVTGKTRVRVAFLIIDCRGFGASSRSPASTVMGHIGVAVLVVTVVAFGVKCPLCSCRVFVSCRVSCRALFACLIFVSYPHHVFMLCPRVVCRVRLFMTCLRVVSGVVP